jgi:hypothetical protein
MHTCRFELTVDASARTIFSHAKQKATFFRIKTNKSSHLYKTHIQKRASPSQKKSNPRRRE